MSKDSPFLGKNTYTHPSTKQLLDLNPNVKKQPLDYDKLALMSTEQQIKILQGRQKPKMFTNIMREGMSREMQLKIKDRFDPKIQKKVMKELKKDAYMRRQRQLNVNMELKGKELEDVKQEVKDLSQFTPTKAPSNMFE